MGLFWRSLGAIFKMSPSGLRAAVRGINTRNRAHRPDYNLVIATYGLLLWGIIMIYSIGPVLSRSTDISVGRQLLAVAVSSVGFWLASKMSAEFWRKILPLLIGLAAVTTLMLILPGDLVAETSRGAKRWLNIGGFSFQPAELVKLTLIIYFAVFLTARIKRGELADRRATLMPTLLILGVVGFFVAVVQKDLGTMLVIVLVVVSMLFAAGVPLKQLAAVGMMGLAAVALMIAIAPHRITRITTFVSPEADPTGSGYHIQQSLIAVGSGGVSGQGLGHSVQAFGYLPEAANDSIFAIHAETIGFIGVIALLLSFGYLMRRIHLQAVAAGSQFNQLIIVGVFAWLLSHIVINVGAMLGLLPLTGITLPLLSYGGSSMVLIMVALGIVFHMSRYSELGILNSHSRSGRESK